MMFHCVYGNDDHTSGEEHKCDDDNDDADDDDAGDDELMRPGEALMFQLLPDPWATNSVAGALKTSFILWPVHIYTYYTIGIFC